jgi:dynein heavy chain
MPHLETLYEQLNLRTEIHRDFRLWLTTLPTNLLPHNILLKGIKATYEPPRGIKNNLTRIYQSLDPDEFETSTKPKEYKGLLFALSFFHATILERKKYGYDYL